ncbi:MAG: threonylcarbamoyl-AMP synthase [Alphaproteobacteria bacterium]|nr:threonylcarbamoyl-AMP synthase [Alphaproteobacteria bacterium]
MARPAPAPSPSRARIAAAARALRAGRLVAFPTETVYGLGADATSDAAVAAIYAAKGRPRFNPLIVHVDTLAAAERLVVFDARARRLARRFWPGPLTLVLPRRARCPVSWLASAGLDCLAVRIPDHDVARALLRAAARPVVAPSANRSGRVSPTRAEHVARDLGRRVDTILDGGASRVGVESTVVDLTGPRAVLLRPGGADPGAIEAALGARLRRPRGIATGPARGAPRAPGQLASHYAPRAAVRLGVRHPRPGEAYLGFGPMPANFAGPGATLSARRDLGEAAANLFAMLRALDRRRVTTIAVAPIPRRGLGLAINDRLARAAAPRP